MIGYKYSDFLPTSKKEIEALGWDYVDVVIFTGDAYVDHPSFGSAMIGRVLQSKGYRVAIVPQPNWRDDLRDFKKTGKPRLFFGVTSGAMDSMVNRYTANKRLRSDDAYSPDGKSGYRPDRALTVYCKILKTLYPDVPVIAGGIEASLRRLTHYDYWSDSLMPSVIIDCGADFLVYGLGEKPVVELARRIKAGEKIENICDVNQTVFKSVKQKVLKSLADDSIYLNSYEQCLADKRKFAENFRIIETESAKYRSARLTEDCGDYTVTVNPPCEASITEDCDFVYDLPYTRLPHPRYKGKKIPAYDMIRNSINIHRGCFGGCGFCTVSAHQGKFVNSRSQESVLKEVGKLVETEGFKGHVTDLGGPSANMYGMSGKNIAICKKCKRPSCIFPSVCRNLNNDHSALMKLYDSAKKTPGVKKITIGSGIRYDLFMNESGYIDESGKRYFETVVKNHVSGRLKVAPEHTSEHVLNGIRKPSFKLYEKLRENFLKINDKYDLNQQLIPYFISGLPRCTESDMKQLSAVVKQMRYKPEQVQSFTPTPMTLASVIYYTKIDPYSGENVYVADTSEERRKQLSYFFLHKN